MRMCWPSPVPGSPAASRSPPSRRFKIGRSTLYRALQPYEADLAPAAAGRSGKGSTICRAHLTRRRWPRSARPAGQGSGWVGGGTDPFAIRIGGSHEVTDFRSSSSVVPRSLPARPRSMSTATRISVFSVIRSPSPPRWRLRVRRILASSSSWSARSRSSLRSRPFHLAVCDSVTPAVRDSGAGRAARGPGARRVRAGAFGGAGAGAPSAAAGGAGRDGSTAGTTGASWPASLSRSATLWRGISSRPSRPRSGPGPAAARYARA